MLAPALLERALETLGAVLLQRNLTFELVAVGGSSLMLLGLLTRPTRDLDVAALVEHGRHVKADPLPAGLAPRHARSETHWVCQRVGSTQARRVLSKRVFLKGLPRVVVQQYGGLILQLASRFDQIHLKLYAAADQWPASKHSHDLRQLRPTRDELVAAARWTMSQDPADAFRELLRNALREIGTENAESFV